MIFDKPISTTSIELEREVRAETEARERAERAAASMSAPYTLVDQRIEELEHLAAADLVLKMRNVDAFACVASDGERAKYAAIFERTGKQFEAAGLRLKRIQPHAGVPEYLQEGSTIPLRGAL